MVSIKISDTCVCKHTRQNHRKLGIGDDTGCYEVGCHCKRFIQQSREWPTENRNDDPTLPFAPPAPIPQTIDGEFRGTIAELERRSRRYAGRVEYENGVRVTTTTRVYVNGAGLMFAGPDQHGRYTPIGRCVPLAIPMGASS